MRTLLTDIHEVLERVDPAGELVPCEISSIDVGPDVLRLVTDRVRDVLARAGRSAAAPSDLGVRRRVAVLSDPVDIRVGSSSVKPLVRAGLESSFDVAVVVLDDGHPNLHASGPVIAAATREASGADVVVSIGGGTVTDVGKLVCLELGVPHVVVQTAASVDGFTDNVSVILRDGVKRTVPSRWPDAVVADTDVVAGAPAAMNRAGFGEILSMFTAPADWRLANLLGFDDSFHPGPLAMLEEVGEGIETWSPGLATGDPGSTTRLVRALDMRGVATGVAGTTACLSGVEHLVSHMFDASFSARGLRVGLHGAQVGVGSVVAAAAWEHLFTRLEGTDGHAPTVDPDRESLRDTVLEAFAALDADGTMAAECWSAYSAKLTAWENRQDRVAALLARWPDVATELRGLVRGPDELADALRAAGVAARFDELVPRVDPDLVRWAVSSCAYMRNRVTVVDLLIALGWWTPADVSAVLDRAETAGSAGRRSGPAS